MSQDTANLLIEKIRNVLDSQKDTNFPCKTHFLALKRQFDEKAEEHTIIGPDTAGTEGHVDKLRDKLYDLDDLLLECLALSGKQHSSMMSMVNNCTPFKSVSLYNRFRTLKNDIEEILSKLNFVKSDTVHQSEEEEEEYYEYTTSYVDESRIYGWVEDANQIAEEISKNETFSATAIVGIYGTGKTTLAQKVFVHDKMKDKFPVRLWVCIGPECTKEELLYRMLDNLGLDVEEVMETIENVEVVKSKDNDAQKEKSKIGVLLYILYLQLLPKGYLIVFDDVREDMHPEWYRNLTAEPPLDKEWSERFAYGLPKIKDRASAVIVTCRKEEFARKMVDAGGIYSPERLKEEEAWLVFKRSLEEAMKKALEKDKKKVKNYLENREEIDKKLENDIKDIKKEIEEKSKELKDINDGMELIIAKKRIEAELKETKEVIRRLKEEQLVEAEKKLEEARSDYENEKSLEEIEKEISAQNEHLVEVKDEPEDVQKVILDEIEKLRVTKEQINAKKEKFEISKNNVEEINKAITDKKKEEESREKELAEKTGAIINKEIDLGGLEKKSSVVKKEMEKKKNIVSDAEENARKKKEQLKIEIKVEEIEKIEKDLKETTDKIIEDLKLERMKKQIRDKCLGLPVALIEAAKGLAFEEYNKLYHPDE